MKPLIITGTSSTPSIVLDKDGGVFEIQGISRPEDTLTFFRPVVDWFKEYSINPNPVTNVAFKMIYQNSSSSRMFMSILLSLKQNLVLKGNQVNVEWHYVKVDESQREVGEDFSSLLDMPFDFVEM
ncbi:MAG: DUF1987 domain-containing protein [Salinivirgaceae bacterium]|nr:DUF1987 domain-containing protein [Salinivirgaceae bacterium]